MAFLDYIKRHSAAFKGRGGGGEGEETKHADFEEGSRSNGDCAVVTTYLFPALHGVNKQVSAAVTSQVAAVVAADY